MRGWPTNITYARTVVEVVPQAEAVPARRARTSRDSAAARGAPTRAPARSSTMRRDTPPTAPANSGTSRGDAEDWPTVAGLAVRSRRDGVEPDSVAARRTVRRRARRRGARPSRVPVLAAAAVAIRRRMGRPILFRHDARRSGRGAVRAAEAALDAAAAAGRDGLRTPTAPGSRRSGGSCASTSIDELPSLVNVLRGDMAHRRTAPAARPLPRALHRPAAPTAGRPRRASPAGRRSTGATRSAWEDRLELDVWYVEHRSLALDVRILAGHDPGGACAAAASPATGHATMAELPAPSRMTTVTVLVSSAGRRVELLRAFRAALHDLDLDGRVLATDRSWYSSARHSADEQFQVPGCDDPDFVPRMVELCAEQRVDLVVPTIDPELPVLAAARDELAAVGTTVAVSSPEVVGDRGRQAGDPRLARRPRLPDRAPGATRRRARPTRSVAVPARRQAAVRERRARRGRRRATRPSSRSRRGPATSSSRRSRAAPSTRSTSSSTAPGACVCAVPRRRIEVRAGEVAKAVTVRSPTLERLAVDGVRGAARRLRRDHDPGVPRRAGRRGGDHRAQRPLRRWLPALPRGGRRLPALDARGAHRPAVDGSRRRLAGRPRDAALRRRGVRRTTRPRREHAAAGGT